MRNAAGFALVASVLCLVPLRAQEPPLNLVEAGRSNWGVIADSLMGRLSTEQRGTILLAVETGEGRSVIENVLLERLEAGGFRVALSAGALSDQFPLLRISGISTRQDAGEDGAPVVTTRCEARWEEAGGTATLLGRFDSSASVGSPGEGHEGTVMDRIFEPLIVIAGTIMIVYLFFTVRS